MDICALEIIVDKITYFIILVEAPIKKYEKYSLLDGQVDMHFPQNL